MDTKLRCVFEMPEGPQQSPVSDTMSKATDVGAHYVSNIEMYFGIKYY